MHCMIKLRRGGRKVLLMTGWFMLGASVWASSGEAGSHVHGAAFQPLLHPLAWHRAHWRHQRPYDPALNIELPWALFDPYFEWDQAPRPNEPPRPGVRPRERGDSWRDDVVGSGSGGRIEVHPEGRILRSRPRSD